MLVSRRAVTAGLASAVTLAATKVAFADEYPAQPVRIVVPFPPGNFSDVVGRLLTDEMKQRHNATLIVDNRAGATGAIGIQAVTRAQPDGYTLLLSSSSPLTVNPAVRKSVPFDVLNDLVPISLIGWSGFLIVAPPDFPANTLAEAVALMRASPDKYVAANPGAGTAGHLLTELISRTIGAKLAHASYRGSGQALMDISQGRVHIMIDAMTSSLSQVRGGNVKALAVTSPKRSPLIPEVPSIKEAGVPELADIDVVAWAGLFAPAKTPSQIVSYWSERLNALSRDKAFVQRLAAINVEAAPPGTPEQLHHLMGKELARWSKVARDANIALGSE